MPAYPAHEGRFMRRLEAEQIDDDGRYGASPASVWVGAGDLASGLRFCPPTRVDDRWREPPVWCGARAPCLARTAPGRCAGIRPGGTTAALRGARWTGTGANASSPEARSARRKMPPVERRKARRPDRKGRMLRLASAAIQGAPLGAPLPSFFKDARDRERRRPGAFSNNPGQRSFA